MGLKSDLPCLWAPDAGLVLQEARAGMLSQVEIQGHVTSVNLLLLLPLLAVQDLHREAAVRYRQKLVVRARAQGGVLTRGELQLVEMVNSGPSCVPSICVTSGTDPRQTNMCQTVLACKCPCTTPRSR